MTLTTSDFNYQLEDERIAQSPVTPRDQSRLLILGRADGRIAHNRFCELPELLREGDLLVLNDTRVIPAKFTAQRVSGGIIDGLFLREPGPGNWEVLLRKAGRCRPNESLSLIGSADVSIQLIEDLGRGRWLVRVSPQSSAIAILDRVGSTPLPPYIRRQETNLESTDRVRYQTVYASRPGAVAAPTAGLHFTEAIFENLTARRIETVCVTLHVSLGTFAPVKCEDLSQHKMHSEWYELSETAAEKINHARRTGRRIVAVGTTSVRVLESSARQSSPDEVRPISGWTDLFLYPPAEFLMTDALVTNFHLPRSTLLMLVAGFCSPGKTDGLETILRTYAEARMTGYQFYSYGDAMLIE